MNVLVLNGGSSSLKYHLFDMDHETTVFHGIISNIALEGCCHSYVDAAGCATTIDFEAADHRQALALAFKAIADKGKIDCHQVQVIGHRVVHGADRFRQPVIIDDAVESTIADCVQFAPLHNPINLRIVKAARAQLPAATHIAVFDTAFHNTIPEFAAVYGIPYEYYHDYHLRRYGFHGNSHQYVAHRAAQYLARPIEKLKMITCHLGNGASICAIDGGRSVDTSMGLTPLEGLVMGTRCGDIDPALITHLAQLKQLDLAAVNNLLNKQSGLLGISGISSDMQVIEEAANKGDQRARLAFNTFCYRVKKYLGAYMLALGSVDAVVFTGGIGENSQGVRLSVLENTNHFGLCIDKKKNNQCKTDKHQPVFDIAAPESNVQVLVTATNEELMIARQCLGRMQQSATSAAALHD